MSAEQHAPEAEFKEFIDGNLPNQEDEPELHPWTGKIANPRVRAHLHDMARDYDPDDYDMDMPARFEDTEYCKNIVAKWSTETGTEALFSGNIKTLNFFSGLVGYQKDVSGMQVLMELMKMIENTPVFIGYIYGDMGSGKSNFAMLLFEVFESIYGEENIYRAANITSDTVDEEIEEYSRLVDLLEDRRERVQAGEDVDEMLMLIDEAAQIFTGTGSDQWKAKALAKVLKLARKAKANMILIGQDGKDIDASLRALCTTSWRSSPRRQPCSGAT